MRLALALLALVLPAPAILADPGARGLVCSDSQCNFEATVTQGPANEVYVAVDPNDPDHVVAVAKDYTLGASSACGVTRVWLGWYTSFDGGKTWLNGLAPGYPGGPPGSLTGYGCVSDPVVAIGGDGSVYISGLPISGPGGKRGVIVFQSLDGGRTFPIHGWAVESTALHDKNWLAVDPLTHRVYVTWTQFSSNGGIMATSAAGGPASAASGKLEFATPQCIGCGAPALLSRLLDLEMNGQGSFIAVGLDGTVYVTWLRGSGIVLSLSVTQGLLWTPPVEVYQISPPGWSSGGGYRTPTLPQIAVDRSTPLGNLYLVWQDARHGDPDVMVASSATRGLVWSDPVRLNDDAVGNKKGQIFPTVCVGSDGKVSAAWYDRRDDPNDYLLNVYGTTSSDGGATWAANTRLTTASSDPRYSKHQGGFTFIGDYIGIACAKDGTAWAAWADMRKLTADVFVARFR